MLIRRLLLLSCATCSCEQIAEYTAWRNNNQPKAAKLEKLYYQADTVIRRNDSVLIYNSRLDTTLIETGIFTYLAYDYPLTTSGNLVQLSKAAIEAEQQGYAAVVSAKYEAIITFYKNNWLTRKQGFENSGFSDFNDYYASNTNVAILVARALEKQGQLQKARAVLAPFMANVEAEHTRIHEQYISLCILQYGKIATRQALQNCGLTVYRPANQPPESDCWRVKVSGADLGIADFNTAALSAAEAQILVQQQSFYELIN